MPTPTSRLEKNLNSVFRFASGKALRRVIRTPKRKNYADIRYLPSTTEPSATKIPVVEIDSCKTESCELDSCQVDPRTIETVDYIDPAKLARLRELAGIAL